MNKRPTTQIRIPPKWITNNNISTTLKFYGPQVGKDDKLKSEFRDNSSGNVAKKDITIQREMNKYRLKAKEEGYKNWRDISLYNMYQSHCMDHRKYLKSCHNTSVKPRTYWIYTHYFVFMNDILTINEKLMLIQMSEWLGKKKYAEQDSNGVSCGTGYTPIYNLILNCTNRNITYGGKYIDKNNKPRSRQRWEKAKRYIIRCMKKMQKHGIIEYAVDIRVDKDAGQEQDVIMFCHGKRWAHLTDAYKFWPGVPFNIYEFKGLKNNV